MSKIFNTRHLLAGLMVGSFDIIAALVQYYLTTGKNPQAVLLYIASGVFGKQAFEGGTAMLIAGLCFHFLIAISFSFLFFTLVSRFPILLQQKIFLMALYGVFMWAFVRYAIMPFSQLTAPPFKVIGAVIAVLILIACISFPLTMIAEKELKTKG